ncbi:uncharacterized mitochondrial protein-like protein [Tanacetum coccineum]|uniref:Uncharacterized mitochondrial protein-like protein n=1 Tax=Tanacetum coccineum TaxID=301880 RepID=A0ABQ4ZLS5_9ASTR
MSVGFILRILIPGIVRQLSTIDSCRIEALYEDNDRQPLFFSTILVLLLNTLNALLLVEYPTKNPSSAFPSNLSRTNSMNYKPVIAEKQSNGNAGTKACDDAGKTKMETIPNKDYILLPLWTNDLPFSSSSKDSPNAGSKPSGEEEKKNETDIQKRTKNKAKNNKTEHRMEKCEKMKQNQSQRVNQAKKSTEKSNSQKSRVHLTEVSDNEKKVTEEPGKKGGDSSNDQEKEDSVNSTNNVNVAITNEVNAVGAKTSIELLDDSNMPELEDIVYSDDDEDVGAKADMNNLNTFMPVSPIPTTRIHKDHPVEQIIRDLKSAPQTRRMTKNLEEQEEPKKMDVKSAFLYGKIEEEVYVCQPPGFEDPDFPDRNGFQRGKIDKTLFIKRDKGDIMLVQVYVDDIIFGFTKKSLCIEFEKMMHKKFQMSSVGELIFFLGLQVKQKKNGIFISQDKYVTEILKKYGFTNIKTASTPMETQKPFLKDEDGEEVNVHLYRSMIGSLMYLTSSRPDIMFAVCAYAR